MTDIGLKFRKMHFSSAVSSLGLFANAMLCSLYTAKLSGINEYLNFYETQMHSMIHQPKEIEYQPG